MHDEDGRIESFQNLQQKNIIVFTIMIMKKIINIIIIIIIINIIIVIIILPHCFRDHQTWQGAVPAQ
jgi:hypothetical protein